MSVSTLLSDLDYEVLSECFRVAPFGRVIWRPNAVKHFQMRGRVPKTFGNNKIAAGENGTIRFNYANYREEDIAWRLQVGVLPTGARVRRIDPDDNTFFPDNLKVLCNSGIPATVGLSWGIFR